MPKYDNFLFLLRGVLFFFVNIVNQPFKNIKLKILRLLGLVKFVELVLVFVLWTSILKGPHGQFVKFGMKQFIWLVSLLIVSAGKDRSNGGLRLESLLNKIVQISFSHKSKM